MFRKYLPRNSCRLSDNVEKYDRGGQTTDDNTIRRMRIICSIPKAKDTRSEYLTLRTGEADLVFNTVKLGTSASSP